MARPALRLDRETVKRKIGRTWPDHVGEVIATLDRINVHGANAETPTRAQLAVLKPSEGNREEIVGLVGMASRDYRDAVAGAEYPEQMRDGPVSPVRLTDHEIRAHEGRMACDRQQYLAWLNKDGV